jgi:hypothetical protein
MVVLLVIIVLVLIESIIHNNKKVVLIDMQESSRVIFNEIKVHSLKVRYNYIDIFGFEHVCDENISGRYKKIYLETGTLPIRSIYGLILHIIIASIFIYVYSRELHDEEIMSASILLLLYTIASIAATLG